MTVRIAGLPMYDFPEIRDATNAFWTLLASELRNRGLADVPTGLERPQDLPSFWADPALLFGQTCGYPLSIGLCGDAQLVATPVYSAKGCEGPAYGSVLIVPATSDLQTLADTQGTICAINMRDSNTGMNLLRASIADHGGKAPFFSAVIETGSHRQSLAKVACGEAQLAAIDSVSFAHFERIEPDVTANVRIIGETAKTPGLPFITAKQTPEALVLMLRDALMAIIHQAPRAPCLDVLMLKDIALLPRTAYAAVMDLERKAAAQSYPLLA
jgi:ABC-type phosphate/phosphonate transport system substrate-binding protein